MAGLPAQTPEPDLPRPGTVLTADIAGSATVTNGDQRKPLKVDERIRIGATVSTGRRSMLTLVLSNGAKVQLGSDTELEIEEFGQAPQSGTTKFADLKEEPTISRTRLRLIRGDVQITVKPLKASRGSSFLLALLAGTVRTREGTFRAMIEMSDLGLGVCSIDLQNGMAEFEPAGGAFAPIPTGRKLSFAIEQDKRTGAVKLGEMPKATAPAKK